jgi:hypothetical protein
MMLFRDLFISHRSIALDPIAGPNAFERSSTLEGSAGEQEPHVIGKLVARMMPRRGFDREFQQLLVAALVSGADAGALTGRVPAGRQTLLALSAFR